MSTLRQLFRFLSPRERRQVLLLLPLLIATALVQVVGIASVVPFLAVVADPDAMTRYVSLARLYELGGFEEMRSFLIALGALMFVIIVGSNGLNVLSTWAVLRFSWMRSHTIAVRILRGFLARPYVFFLEQHSADLGRNLLGEVVQIVTGTLVPAMKALSGAIVALAVLALLFYVDPLLALLTGVVMGGAYGLLFFAVRRRQRHMGQVRLAANKGRYKTLAETFGGIKDVKLLGREATMVRRFARPSADYAAATALNAVVAEVPRFALEGIALGGVVLMVLYLVQREQGFEAIVPTIGLYTFAGYRLMPALQQIFHGLTNIRFNSAGLDNLREYLPAGEVEFSERRAVAPLPLARSIRYRDVWFQYPTAKEPLFRGVDLVIEAGRSTAFVGATGSGKSTLGDLLLGLLRPDRGEIEIDGVPVDDANLRAWQRNLGYVPQSIFLADDTITRNIAFGLPDERIDREAVVRAARAACIDEFVEHELPKGYDTVVGERGVRLSGGQRQRIGIARALYHDPQVILFDEATSSLDNVTEEQVLEAVAELARTRTTITIAHRLSTVRACDRILLLAGGEVVASGTYDELLASEPRFQALALAGPGR
ncbi:MAG TPA: ABC transporter ATP-binding protein [Thermoanaerobaculia bacterium]|nr:ABC transporter ATP-binding protein [Thermoanaerobaculia bacterium]